MPRILRVVLAACLAAAFGTALTAADRVVAWPCVALHPLGQPVSCKPARTPADRAAASVPGGPTRLTGSASGSVVSLAWAAPAGGDAPTSYVVEAGSSSGRADLASFDTGGSAVSLTVSGVPAGTYYVRVRARNQAGVGIVSNEIMLTVLSGSGCAARPGAPTALSSSVAGSSVTLTWTAPTGGCAPTSYVIEAGSISGASDLANLDTGGTGTTYNASGVPSGMYYVRVKAANAIGASAASNETTLTVTPAAAPTCSTWANTLRASGLPTATGSQATYRDALFAAGGGVKSINAKSYAVWFPPSWASSSPRRVIVGLHGSDGYAEQDWWFNWKDSTRDRNWAYIGLTYLNATTGIYDDEPVAYTNLKAAIDEIKASCDFGSPSSFLVGFSRGSAMTFGVGYLDIKDRRLFKAIGENSGAWPVGGPLTPTMQGFVSRGETAAYSGGRFWMYCGLRDNTHAAPMCDEMANARTFVTSYAGTVAELFQDPTGGHGGLASNPAALSSMYTYFESLR